MAPTCNEPREQSYATEQEQPVRQSPQNKHSDQRHHSAADADTSMADLEAANEDFQPSPPTTPESRVDYNARKAANDNVLQVVASVSSGSNDNTDLNQAELGVQKEAASSSGIHSVSQGVGEATEDGGPSKIDYATMSWWHTGISECLTTFLHPLTTLLHPLIKRCLANSQLNSHDSRDSQPRHPLSP